MNTETVPEGYTVSYARGYRQLRALPSKPVGPKKKAIQAFYDELAAENTALCTPWMGKPLDNAYAFAGGRNNANLYAFNRLEDAISTTKWGGSTHDRAVILEKLLAYAREEATKKPYRWSAEKVADWGFKLTAEQYRAKDLGAKYQWRKLVPRLEKLMGSN